MGPKKQPKPSCSLDKQMTPTYPASNWLENPKFITNHGHHIAVNIESVFLNLAYSVMDWISSTYMKLLVRVSEGPYPKSLSSKDSLKNLLPEQINCDAEIYSDYSFNICVHI